MRMDEIIRICLPFMGTFDLTDDNYRLFARRISDAPQGHSCLLNPKVHVSPVIILAPQGRPPSIPKRVNQVLYLFYHFLPFIMIIIS